MQPDMSDVFDSVYGDAIRLAAAVESGSASVGEIVQAYYAASNLYTLAIAQNDNLLLNNSSLSNVQVSQAKSFLHGRFNRVIHPMARDMVDDLVKDTTAKLRHDSMPDKGRGGNLDVLHSESAKAYELLRELLSAREFIAQYAAVACRSDVGSADDGNASSGLNGAQM